MYCNGSIFNETVFTYGPRLILKNLEFVDKSDEQLTIEYGKGCKYDFEGHKLCNAIWPTIVDFIFSYNLLTYLLTLRLVICITAVWQSKNTY